MTFVVQVHEGGNIISFLFSINNPLRFTFFLVFCLFAATLRRGPRSRYLKSSSWSAHSKNNTILIQRTFESQVSQRWHVLQHGYLFIHTHSTCLHCIYAVYIQYLSLKILAHRLCGLHWITCVHLPLGRQLLKKKLETIKAPLYFLSKIPVVLLTFKTTRNHCLIKLEWNFQV